MKRTISLTFLLLASFRSNHAVHAYRALEPSESFPIWSDGGFAVTIDVRTRAEYATGHLPGAFLAENMASTRVTPPELLACKECAVAVYCRTGARARTAAGVLEDDGFVNVTNILGVTQLFGNGLFPSEVGDVSGNVTGPFCSDDEDACLVRDDVSLDDDGASGDGDTSGAPDSCARFAPLLWSVLVLVAVLC